MRLSSMAGEIWADVPGAEGLYLVSNMGRVWALPRIVSNRPCGGFYPKISVKRKGYLAVTLSGSGVLWRACRMARVHILVAKAFVPNPNPDVFDEVNHRDGDKSNCKASNLIWTNSSGNIRHAMETNLLSYKKLSSYHGVSSLNLAKKIGHQKWRAQLSIRGYPRLAKACYTEWEAAKAYNDFVEKHGIDRPLNQIPLEDPASPPPLPAPDRWTTRRANAARKAREGVTTL